MRSSQIFENLTEVDLNLISTLPYKKTFYHDVKVAQFNIEDGYGILQSLEHYIANIHVIECSLAKANEIKLHLSKSTAFFEVLNSSGVKVKKEGIALDEYSEPICSLVNYPKGNYSYQFSKGTHRLILANLNIQWLNAIVELYPSFSALLTNNKKNHYQRMPECPYRKEIRKTINNFIYSGKYKLANHAPDLALMLNKIIKQYHNQFKDGELHNASKLQNKAKQLISFLDTNYSNPEINTTMIAKYLMMSEKSLQRLSQLIFGRGLREQIIKCRMIHAVKFLAINNKSVKAVAKLTGYKSAAYFSRAFSSYWGVSPSEMLILKKMP